jgi:uncharacterized membrane protein
VVAEGETLQVLDWLVRLVVVAAVVLILLQRGTELRHRVMAEVLVQSLILVMVAEVAAAQAQPVLLAQVVVVGLAVMALRPQ